MGTIHPPTALGSTIRLSFMAQGIVRQFMGIRVGRIAKGSIIRSRRMEQTIILWFTQVLETRLLVTEPMIRLVSKVITMRVWSMEAARHLIFMGRTTF